MPPGARIRLLAVLSSLAGGGAERQMALLLRHIDRTKFEPALCLLETEAGPYRRLIPDDVTITVLGKTSRRDAPRLITRLGELIRRTRPNVVYSKLFYPNVIAAAACAITPRSPALVVGEDSIESVELQHLSHPRVRSALIRWAYRRAARIVVPSPGVGADLTDRLRVRARAIDPIPNMVDLAALKDAATTGDRARFTEAKSSLVASAGRLEPAKGQADLLEAVALLNRRRPVNVILIGEGQYRTELERTARDLGIFDRVAFTGFLADPFPVIASVDVFVSPSHWESFGNTIIEAMALGVPVVSTRVATGPEWLIEHERTGLFARPGDPGDLAQQIGRVLDDPVLAAGLAQRGLEEVERYEVGRVVGLYEQTLRGACVI